MQQQHMQICICNIACPVCGGRQYIFDWKPGHCVHCNTLISGWGNGDYQIQDEVRTIVLDQMTGELKEISTCYIRDISDQEGRKQITREDITWINKH